MIEGKIVQESINVRQRGGPTRRGLHAVIEIWILLKVKWKLSVEDTIHNVNDLTAEIRNDCRERGWKQADGQMLLPSPRR